MNPTELARAFHDRKFVGPNGPLVPRRALLTRKSLLLFSDDLVLKLRRPREVDGYDQSMMSVRYAMIGRERWLGRQLSPEVYLDDCVLLPDDNNDKVILHRGFIEGEPIVMMRRLPDAQRADHLLLAEADPAEARRLLDRAMVRLARFHAEAEHHASPPFGDAGRARSRFEAVLAQVMVALTPEEHAGLAGETAEWLAALEPTLAHRVAERRVRSLHGEMRLEHLFLPGQGVADAVFIDPNDGPDSERALDTAEEVMGLALELDALIGPEASDRVIETYATGTADATLRKVARFYKRLGCLHRAAEALRDAAEPQADAAEAKGRARFFIERALT